MFMQGSSKVCRHAILALALALALALVLSLYPYPCPNPIPIALILAYSLIIECPHALLDPLVVLYIHDLLGYRVGDI